MCVSVSGHACVRACVQTRVAEEAKKQEEEEEEYSGQMGVFRSSVMEQISTGPCMPACVVYSHTLLETDNTPQS